MPIVVNIHNIININAFDNISRKKAVKSKAKLIFCKASAHIYGFYLKIPPLCFFYIQTRIKTKNETARSAFATDYCDAQQKTKFARLKKQLD